MERDWNKIVGYKKVRIRTEAAEVCFKGLLLQSPENTEETHESLRIDLMSNICGVPVSYNLKLLFETVSSLDHVRLIAGYACKDYSAMTRFLELRTSIGLAF